MKGVSMLNTLKCDKCGKVYDPKELRDIEDFNKLVLFEITETGTREIDLCPEHYAELSHWFND